MKNRSPVLLRQYETALSRHVARKSGGDGVKAARRLGATAMARGMETLDLARIHERALLRVMARSAEDARDGVFRRAGTFFAEALSCIERTHRTARDANAELKRLNQSLSRRAKELATANQQLEHEIIQRKEAEIALKNSEQHYSELLRQSRQMQEQLRYLSRQLLLAQEEERKMISRELHDEIAQTLTGINVQLADLKASARIDVKSLGKKITSTQRLVERSVKIVHQFARELRPSLLDDLGLIPALHSFVKAFAARTHLHVRLRIFAGVEKLDNAKRTVLYRVAQEALTNIYRHARATHVDMCIEKVSGLVRMRIKDDGKSFPVQRTLHGKKYIRLGLLGMRERTEMVGGSFNITSAPGEGTEVEVQIPIARRDRKRGTPLTE